MYIKEAPMKVSEKRTQMYFPKKLYAHLEAEAKKEEKSVASLVREAAEAYLAKKSAVVDWDNDPLWNLVGIVESDRDDGSINHDDTIYALDGIKRRRKKT